MGDSELTLPADASAAGAARRFVTSWLTSQALEPLCETVVLLTSELVTNVLLHVGGSAQLLLRAVDGGVRVEVSDPSPTGPTQRRRNPEAGTGRGIRLLDDLSDEWGWTPTRTGKRIWFTVTSAADPWAAFRAPEWREQAGS